MAHRSRRLETGSETRRRFLFRVGAAGAALVGVAAAARETGAYTAITGGRTSAVDAAAEGDGIVGIVGQGPVKKNNREAMVEITNNGPDSVTYTVALSTCSDGTLYDNDGESGCSVSFSLGSGNAQFVDIEADVTGTIPYTISVADPGFSFDSTETVESESGNVKGALKIYKPDKDKEFTANPLLQGNDWEIKDVDVRDEDGDNDLDRVEFEVKEGGSGGDVVGSKTVSDIPGDRWAPTGNPDVTIEPDSATYTVQSGQLYTLVMTAYDADGNFDSVTLEDTA